jgi:transaldolase
MSNGLLEIEAPGQSVWIDNISRQLLRDGIMARLVEEDGISGVTSNPTIFEKAMGHSDRYDDAFREVIGETEDPRRSSSGSRISTSERPPTSSGPR